MTPGSDRDDPTSLPAADAALSAVEMRRLRSHHNQTIGLFVAFWIFLLAVVAADSLLDLPDGVPRNMVGVLFGAALVMVLLQFAKRCPRCRANLGWQVRLGVPRQCRRCGVRLSRVAGFPTSRRDGARGGEVGFHHRARRIPLTEARWNTTISKYFAAAADCAGAY